MSLPLIFRAPALAEFEEAAIWHEGQSAGLGVDFVTEVQKVLDMIANRPARYPIVSGDTREAPVSRFSYCVYYRVKSGRVVILAVLHTSRDPAIWQSRA